MRQNFTNEEWAVLLQAPMQAIVAITLADKTDPVSFLRELKGGVDVVMQAMQSLELPSEVAKSLTAAIQEIDAQEVLRGEQLNLKKEFELLALIQSYKSASEGRKLAVTHFEQVASLLAAKTTGVEATAFKQWLMSLAQKVAEVSKEGGFLGIGSSRVSEKESDMLKQLAGALGLSL